MSRADVTRLTGNKQAYMLEPWVYAGLAKLDLAYEARAGGSAGGVVMVSIRNVSNGPNGRWVHSANGVPSPYHLDTQLADGISVVELSFAPPP